MGGSVAEVWSYGCELMSEKEESSQNLPSHVALQFKHTFPLGILALIQEAFVRGINIITIRSGTGTVNSESLQNYSELLEKLCNWDFVSSSQVKVTVLGQWYSVPDSLIEQIKKISSSTQDYDARFLTICINYDGKEEITNACKLIAKQVQLGKLRPEEIDQETIKENLYSSYFVPPDLVITEKKQALQGMLLWDAADATVCKVDVLNTETLRTAIKNWAKE